jgi:Domain of unknown function (DUF3786)
MNETVYADIIRGHLSEVFQGENTVLASYPGIQSTADGFELMAFGQPCCLSSRGVLLDNQPDWGPRGIIISLLARHAVSDVCIETPWRAFRELPDSAPYVGAFRAHTEQILVPHVSALYHQREGVRKSLQGRAPEGDSPGDWALVLNPLPKIALCYHFYLPDEDFPANVTCLYANNADRFLPTDALADVGEYMSRALIARLS